MGINFSRLLTIKYGNTMAGFLNEKYSVISVGRVMTCVLGMVVRREREIRDFVKENDTVKVKVLSISEDGKISLSMKKAEPQQAAPAKTERPARPKRTAPPRDMGWRGPKPTPEPQSFEDMMNRFKQTSDDKMSDLKKYMDGKRGTSFKRGQR